MTSVASDECASPTTWRARLLLGKDEHSHASVTASCGVGGGGGGGGGARLAMPGATGGGGDGLALRQVGRRGRPRPCEPDFGRGGQVGHKVGVVEDAITSASMPPRSMR